MGIATNTTAARMKIGMRNWHLIPIGQRKCRNYLLVAQQAQPAAPPWDDEEREYVRRDSIILAISYAGRVRQNAWACRESMKSC